MNSGILHLDFDPSKGRGNMLLPSIPVPSPLVLNCGFTLEPTASYDNPKLTNVWFPASPDADFVWHVVRASGFLKTLDAAKTVSHCLTQS